MKKIYQFILFILLLSFSNILLPVNLPGQENKTSDWLKKYPLVFAFGNNVHSLPLHRIFRLDPFYPSFSLGTEFMYTKGRYGQLLQTANIGGFYHKYSAQGFFLSSDFTYRYDSPIHIFADIGIGLGYLHIFHPAAVYEYKSGKYKQVRDWGSPRLAANIIFDMGYNFTEFKKPFRIFIRYKPFLFLYREELPAINTNTQIGFSLFIK